MTGRTLDDWLHHLETRCQTPIQLGLSRFDEVAKKIGLKLPSCPVITVAGTNGKGSTVAVLEAIYREAGYRVGTYTSPHIKHFRERIQYEQRPIEDAYLIEAFETIEAARGAVELTYFEVTTLAALLFFQSQPLDCLILEVGMGGRLDATNWVNADVAVITSIAFDHEAYLGHTLEAIGAEKAGILRPGKPVVYGSLNPPQSVLNAVHELKTPFYALARDYHIDNTPSGYAIRVKDIAINFPRTTIHPHALGAAVMVSLCLEDTLPVPVSAFTHAIQHVTLLGRLTRWQFPHATLLDVAHNPHSVDYLAHYLATEEPERSIRVVFSAMSDKAISGMITPLKERVTAWYPARLPLARAADEACLMDAFGACEIKVPLCYNDPILAYEAACKASHPDDLIVVYGSFVLVGLLWSAHESDNR